MNWIKENKSIIIILAIILIAIIIIKNPGIIPSRSLAECVKRSGAKFYGTKTCPHCINQKNMFGSSAGNLPYVECSSQSGSEICAKNNIQKYPTWIFSDGTRHEGEISLQALAEKTKCTKSNKS